MMPIPSHLTNCVTPDSSEIDESPLLGKVQCPCGSDVFQLLYPGRTREHEEGPIPCVAEIDGKFFFLIKAKCCACKKEHLLIDIDFHGWNGFVCHEPNQANLPRPSLVPWKCLSCGSTEHKATILVSGEGKLDFIEETEGEFDEDRWPDGFGCFAMAIACSKCEKSTDGWISMETM